MDVELLERLVRLMTANDLNTVEVRDGAKRVVLKRGAAVTVPPGMYPAAAYHAVRPGSAAQATQALGAASGAGAGGESDKDLLAIKSPMVGTFYSAPSPDAPPFVSTGAAVDEDTDVCIIEAMKVFNNIKAECRGTIERVLVTNGQTVEFGQVLFLVRPA